jgi:cell division protein FtsI/penicillin-binding protein 2
VLIVPKTGSAENPNENRCAWSAGYGPVDDPRVVVVVMVRRADLRRGRRAARPQDV